MKELVVLGIEDHADFAAAALDISNRHAVVAHASQEIVRPVDGIYDPDAILRSAERRRSFLSKKTVLAKLALDLSTDQLLDSAVGLGHEILSPFRFDCERIALDEEVMRETAGFDGNLLCSDIACGNRQGSSFCFIENHATPVMFDPHSRSRAPLSPGWRGWGLGPAHPNCT